VQVTSTKLAKLQKHKTLDSSELDFGKLSALKEMMGIIRLGWYD
jgi:hypothetical protein